MSIKSSTMIGSLPHTDVKKAVELTLESISVPCWPQLPRVSTKEQMHIQFTENFPGIVFNEDSQKIWVDSQKFNNEITDFYQNFLENNIEYFRISKEYSKGFYEFTDQLSKFNNQNFRIKLQVIGPITFSFTIKTESGRAILYDSMIKDAVVKNVVMKSLWQIKQVANCVRERTSTVILFLDEPYLAAYGSAFAAVSREELVAIINETISEIKKSLVNFLSEKVKFLVGVHCCANTDWSILTDSEVDIISFDAHDFFNDFVLYSSNINTFLQKGGTIAWGIVPNNDKINSENEEVIFNRFIDCVETLKEKKIDENLLLKNFIITPQCGLGGTSEINAKKSLTFSEKLAKKISEYRGEKYGI